MASVTEKKPFFIWSCILHASILLALILELSFSGAGHPNSGIENKNIIHAVAINSDVIKQYEQAEIQKETQRKLAQQQAVQKIQELLKKQQQEEQAQVQAEAQKQAAEKLAAEKLAEQKLATEKLAEQKLAEQKLAEQKAVELKQSLQKQLKASMDKQLASEAKANNIKPSNSKPSNIKNITSNNITSNNITSNNLSSGIMDKYKALIIQAISQQWVVPENLPKNINCMLIIRVAPGGVVLDVNVEKSSGNMVLDNSAIAAVKKASPLPVPMEANNFESFRIIKLMVKPDGSLET